MDGEGASEQLTNVFDFKEVLHSGILTAFGPWSLSRLFNVRTYDLITTLDNRQLLSSH